MVTLDLAATFDKVEAMLADGVLGKAVVASFAGLLPKLKSIGLALTRKVRLAKVAGSRGEGQDRDRADPARQ